MIAIIDYDAGTLKSVEKAFLALGEECVVTRDHDSIRRADRVVLPGVGSFGTAMQQLKKYELDQVIREVVQEDKPFLGICLGLQLLFEGSEESDGVEGLHLLDGEIVKIPDHTLYGDYLPKIAESEIKPVIETGEIVLSRVVVPQTVVVHDGVPTNASAANYYVPYRDYIKNVASSEIYATWPRSAIVANVLAIMSFTLNRVYTEWYRNQGYDFTITSSTAYDHKWIYGRNIFESISVVVDDIFDNYLSRPGVKQPILTQYCDGRKVRCPGWMTQWGSCELGEAGYSPIEILRNFYGDDMYINTAEQISGIPASWPGYDLKIGATGDKVRQLQEQLDAIASVYTAIPDITPDGIYGPATAEAVRKFQSIFGLPQTGVVDFATWYKISHIYVGITRIAELS